MTGLRDSRLRVRDLRRLVEPKMQDVVWDAGIDKKNEWIYASTESAAHKAAFVEWLRSKDVDEKEEALLFDSNWTRTRKISWRDLLRDPEGFFCDSPFQAVSMDFRWVLSYMKEGVARFGRWQKKEPNQAPEPTRPFGPSGSS
jgi:hypothetical protein